MGYLLGPLIDSTWDQVEITQIVLHGVKLTKNPKWIHLGNPHTAQVKEPISDPLKSYIGPIWEAHANVPNVQVHETQVGSLTIVGG